MQLLIADSGSTKTDWAVIPENGAVTHLQSPGLNPYFTSAGELTDVVTDQLLPRLNTGQSFEVYFYGAGCGNLSYCELFQSVFETLGAEKAFVETDLLGVARAALGLNEGIAGILGTGANAGFFSNGLLLKSAPSTGYVLGDEGSAAWIGKQLLAAYLRQELPGEIYRSMKEELQLDDKKILYHVYSMERPNRYVAGMAGVLKNFQDHPWVLDILQTGFSGFFKNYIKILGPYSEAPVVLAGTVANIYQKELRFISSREGYPNFSTLPSVIEGLVKFHRSF